MTRNERQKMLEERLKVWENFTPEERKKRRTERLELMRREQGREIKSTDGLPGDWDIPCDKGEKD